MKEMAIYLLAKIKKISLHFRQERKMKDIMSVYYMEAKSARIARRKVAWITSGGPVEPLIAMDIIPVYPENHGAMIGASKMGTTLCEIAEGMGYSNDLCSYARADIACATVNGGPIGGLPRPDLLVCCNNICGTVLKWYEVQARYFQVPLFILDMPFCHTSFDEGIRSYVRRQLDDYITFLEGVASKKMDWAKFAEVGRLSLQAQRLWQEVLDMAVNKPTPISAFDAFYHLALIVTLRGTKEAVDYYTKLLAKLRQRAMNGSGSIPNERYRLLWDNLPIWHNVRWLSNKFAAHDACLVADTYTSAWCGVTKYLDENNFLDSMAEAYTRIYLNIGIDEMARMVVAMVGKYDVDGIVMHSNRSCKPYSFGQYDIGRIVEAECGIPTLLIEADMTDGRMFSAAPIGTRIDAFMELIKTRKNG